jgi:hypothetical protein
MKSSRIVLAAGLLALAPAARAGDAPSKAPAGAQAAALKSVCPDLTGTFACPAIERFKQKAMTLTVKSEPAAKTFEFSYDNGAKPVKVVADGAREPLGKQYSSYVCRDSALIQIVFPDRKTKKARAASKQRLDKDGSYEVSGPDGKVTLLCPRAKRP